MILPNVDYKNKIESSTFTNISGDTVLSLLNKQLDYAHRNSAFYRARLPRSEVEKLSDIEALPFTTVDDIQNHGKEMLCVSAGSIQRIVSLFSSGTTAPPKRIYFTRNDLDRTVSFFSEGMSWLCSPGDNVAILLPCSVPDGVGDLLTKGLERLGCKVLAVGPLEYGAQHSAALSEQKPSVLVGMPWQTRLLSLANPELRPDTVLLSADYVPESMYTFLEDIWGCRVLSHFGMTESCFGGAVECLLHRGMYLRRDELYAEIIDPQSGRVLPPGQIGELVLTTLKREAMPLIRYRTGDLACFETNNSGIIRRVFGRVDTIRQKYCFQEKMCALPYILDYRLGVGTRIQLELLLSKNAAYDTESAIADIAAETLEISRDSIDLISQRCTPFDSRLFTTGKRQ